MIKCDAYHNERNYLGGFGICYGTKEKEPCSCGGDYNKCNFYSHGLKRNNKKELIEKLEDFTEVIKNCSANCDNCNIYETCIEKYSDEKLIDLLNEAIKFIKETED